MAELTTKGRDKLRSSQFAYVDSKGAAAKERARRTIMAAARRHGIKVADDSTTRRQSR